MKTKIVISKILVNGSIDYKIRYSLLCKKHWYSQYVALYHSEQLDAVKSIEKDIQELSEQGIEIYQ